MQKQSHVLTAIIRRPRRVGSPRGMLSGKEPGMRGCRPHRFLAFALAALVMGFAVFGFVREGSAASTIERYRVKGPAAYGVLSSYDDCGYTEFYVDANAFWEKSTAGRPTHTNAVYGSFYHYSGCGDSWTEAYGYGFVNDAAQLDKNLNSASASVSFDVYVSECTYTEEGYYDCTEVAVVPFTGTMDWTGVGTIYSEKSRYSYKTPYSTYRGSFSGSFRHAEVSGDATLAGDLLNFSDAYGQLRSIKSGSVYISRE